MIRSSFASALICVAAVQDAFAQADTYHITPAEKTACTADAQRLCSTAYPDEGKLIVCMKDNRRALSPTCSAVFLAGLKRRGLL